MDSHYIGNVIRRHGNLSTKKDQRIPNHYEQYSYKDSGKTRIFLVCRNIIHGEKCIFAIRKDQYFHDIDKFESHVCKTNNSIENYFQPENSNEEINSIEECIINFVGKNNLPHNIVTKPSFMEFVKKLISFGQQNPSAKIESFFPTMSRQTFSKYFIEYSDKKFKQRLKDFKGKPGSCLAVDAGKHKSISYLLIILVNAWIEQRPLIVDVIRHFKGKEIDYRKDMEKLVLKLFNDDIQITAIVSDNLRSQVTAINHKSVKGMQQKTIYTEVSKTIWLSCACHTLSLALKDSSQYPDFGNLVDNILNTSNFLRSKNISNMLHKVCPSSCKTRWTGVFDIAYWMLRNFDIISDAIYKSLNNDIAYDFSDSIIQGISKTASQLFLILLPFKLAIKILEADKAPAAYVIPIVNEALKQLKEISIEANLSENMINSITNNVNARMKSSQSGRYWTFLYSLTPLGRKELRENSEITANGDDGITLPQFFKLKGDDKQNSLLEKLKDDPEFFTRKGEKIKEEFNNYKGKLMYFKNSKELLSHNSDIDIGEALREEINPPELNLMISKSSRNNQNNKSSLYNDYYSDYYSDYSEEEEESSEESSEESFQPLYIDSNGPLADNLDILKEIATVQGYTPNEIDVLIIKYTEWITDEAKSLILHNQILEMGVKCWKYIEFLPYMKSFAQFVIPLLGIVASEAHCERAFWKQRRILGDQSTRISLELEKAKLNSAVNDGE